MKPRLERPASTTGNSSIRVISHLFSRRRFAALLVVFLSLPMLAGQARVGVSAQEQPAVGPGLSRVGSGGQKSAASSLKAGSVLFFHKFTSDAAKPAQVNTLLTITNTNPRDGVAVHLLLSADCATEDQFFSLAPNQTRTFLMSRERPGATGYAMAVAVNGDGVPTQFNWLTGAAAIRDHRGREGHYNAFAVARRAAGAARHNDLRREAELNFDGIEYDRLPKTIAIDSLPSQAIQDGSALNTDLTIYSPSAQPQSEEYNPLTITAIAHDRDGRGYPEVVDSLCGLTIGAGMLWVEKPLNSIIPAGQTGWAAFSAINGATSEPVPVFGVSHTERIGGAPVRNLRPMQVLEWLESFRMKLETGPVFDPPAEAATGNQPEATGGAEGVSETKAGSALIYPRYVTTGGGLTDLYLTNTSASRGTRVRLFFSNLAATSPITDKIISLAAGQTTTIDAGSMATGQRGWVMAIAIDGGGRPAQFNHLIGSAQVIEGAGAGGASAAYNAIAIGKNAAGSVARNDDATTADLLFDDLNYDRLPASVMLNGVASQDDHSTLLSFARPPSTLLSNVNSRGSIAGQLFDDTLGTASTTIGRTETRLSTLRNNVTSQSFTSNVARGHRAWVKLNSTSPLLASFSSLAGAPLEITGNAWAGGVSGGLNAQYLTVSDSHRIIAPASNPGNSLPVAQAEPLGSVIEARGAAGTIVRLDGRASQDDDLEDKITYQWKDTDKVISDSPVTDFRLSPGLHGVTLTVTDSSGATSVEDEQIVDVRDTTAPAISGIPAVITRVTNGATGAVVNYKLPVAWDMVDGYLPVTASRNPGQPFPLGTTLVTFIAKDKAGNSTNATTSVTVLPGDQESQTGGVPGSIMPVMQNLNDQYIPAGTTREITLKAEDLDGDPVTFSLLGSTGKAEIVNIDSAARKATLRISVGEHDAPYELRVTATDNRRQTFRTLPFRVVVSNIPNDETGSGRKLTNRAPVASIAALPAALQATSADGIDLPLDATGTYDPDGDTLVFVWTDNGHVIAQGATAKVRLAVGKHLLGLTVSDPYDGVGSITPVSVEVLPRSLAVTSVTPNLIRRGSAVTMTINGSGFVPGSVVQFSRSGIVIAAYVSIAEDRIVLKLNLNADAALGGCDVTVITPLGRSARLRSGAFVAQ
ncbi:MAG: HYR domain-containing protein [Blastocatellia bacterium]